MVGLNSSGAGKLNHENDFVGWDGRRSGVFLLVPSRVAGFDSCLMKKFLACTIALGAFAFSGCGEKEEGKASYALVPPSVSAFWEICRKGGEDAAKELDADLEFVTPESITDQKAKI
mgnify:CR=1 FL=1